MKYDIIIDSYIGYPISKGYIRDQLKRFKGRPVTVRINSYGGDVQTALDIRQQFLDHGDVTAYIYGMTASAATILAMGAKKIIMSKFALMLIHRCSGWVDTWGSLNSEQLAEEIKKLSSTKDDLDKIDEIIVNVYASRSGHDAKELAKTMAKGKWLKAEECKKLGLIDEISAEGKKIQITDEVKHTFTACALPLPDVENAAQDADEDADEDAEDENSAEETDIEDVQPVNSLETVCRTFLNNVARFFGMEARHKDETEGSSIDGPQNNQNQTNMEQYTALAALLAVTALTAAEDGSVNLSAEQLKTLNDAVSKLNKKVEDLTAANDAQTKKIEELGKKDGAETKKVEGSQPKDESVDAIFDNIKKLL